MIRRYRTAKGIWGFGVSRGPLGWSVQFAVWVFTTESE